ncbi:MAG: peptidylprolyl isomerase [bacterium]|nr:peptidylprolyl isomerase [bacterium]
MLRVLRKKAKPIFWIVIGTFVAMIFLSWGMNFGGEYFRPQVATVNGKIISPNEFQEAYKNYLDNLKNIYGEDFDTESIPDLRNKVVEGLIQRHILMNQAKQLGIKVSADELQKEIISSFEDTNTYNQYVQGAHPLWWKMKEQEAFRNILVAKTKNLVVNQVKVTTAELNNYYRKEYESAHLKQILIDPNQFVPFSEVEKYYKENVEDEFMKPGKIRASHILLVVPEGAPADQDAAARTKIEELLKQLNGGADFATLAQQNSNCSSRERGGDLGYFGENDMVPEFEKAVYKLEKKGDLSPIVKTKFGYHIIKLEDKLPDEPRLLQDVEDKIRGFLVDKKAEKQAHKQAIKILKELKQGANFEQMAQTYSHAKSGKKGGDLGIIPKRFLDPDDLGTQTIKFIAEEIGIAGAVTNPDFSEKAFELNEGKITDVVKTSMGYHIIKMEKKIAPTAEDLKKEHSRVLINCLYEKKQKVSDDWYASLKTKAKIIKSTE